MSRASLRIRWIEKNLRIPKGVGAGKPVRLRDWQKDLIRGMYGEHIRTGLVSLPRANGKTALAAMLGVAELFVNDDSPEVMIVASDQRQADITFRLARRMLQLSPELDAKVLRAKIVTPHNDGLLIPMPADPAALHGADPSLLIVDELHVVTEEVWEAVSSVTGKRPESLTLAISTPAQTSDSVMWRLVQHGRSGDDPSFFLKEFAAPEGCDIDDHKAWAIANPALGDFLALDGLVSVMKTLRAPTFRQLRLGQWVSGTDSFLPVGAWDALADDEREVGRRDKVVIGFDGSASGDSTALVACTVGPEPHIFVLGLWENPGDPRWRVPRGEVTQAVADAFKSYDVVELACDPWGWRSEIQEWGKKHRKCVEYNTAAAARMGPATDRLYQAVMQEELTHDGDLRLSKHFAHAKAKRTPHGDILQKDRRNSPRKIDAAMAALIAYDRAQHHTNRKTKRARSFAA